MDDTHVRDATVRWLERAVIGLNLCPFAKSVWVKNQVRITISAATTTDALLDELIAELELLAETPAEKIDTTLLVHPQVLSDFYDFNDFLDVAEVALAELGLDGEIQIASFHPDFQFADADPDDITNATNRSPYPTLHLIREASIDRAVEAFPDAADIYERNMEKLRELGPEGWKALGVGPEKPADET
ncbi:DUF1415 domain-containing protein [Niveibacterium umoris]|uniref:DUF1415 domain-containing protein n=1 Tax=Niveibacterium umoris TaxID=1193620 RepID=A0A840BNN5_9RHOO|nr:hypothetical protein [Niveibacterium umoris]